MIWRVSGRDTDILYRGLDKSTHKVLVDGVARLNVVEGNHWIDFAG